MDFCGSMLAASISSLFAAMFFLITSITASFVISHSFILLSLFIWGPLRKIPAHRIIPKREAVVNADYLAVDGVQEPAAEGQNGLPALRRSENHARRNTLRAYVLEEFLSEDRLEGIRVHRAEAQHVHA